MLLYRRIHVFRARSATHLAAPIYDVPAQQTKQRNRFSEPTFTMPIYDVPGTMAPPPLPGDLVNPAFSGRTSSLPRTGRRASEPSLAAPIYDVFPGIRGVPPPLIPPPPPGEPQPPGHAQDRTKLTDTHLAPPHNPARRKSTPLVDIAEVAAVPSLLWGSVGSGSVFRSAVANMVKADHPSSRPRIGRRVSEPAVPIYDLSGHSRTSAPTPADYDGPPMVVQFWTQVLTISDAFSQLYVAQHTRRLVWNCAQIGAHGYSIAYGMLALNVGACHSRCCHSMV